MFSQAHFQTPRRGLKIRRSLKKKTRSVFKLRQALSEVFDISSQSPKLKLRINGEKQP